MVKAQEDPTFDEVVVQIEEGPFYLSLRLGPSDFTSNRLKAVVSAELQEPGGSTEGLASV